MLKEIIGIAGAGQSFFATQRWILTLWLEKALITCILHKYLKMKSWNLDCVKDVCLNWLLLVEWNNYYITYNILYVIVTIFFLKSLEYVP